MAKGVSPDPPVRRAFEVHRLEEQLWSLAFQQIRPVIRKKTKASGVDSKTRSYVSTRKKPSKARSA